MFVLVLFVDQKQKCISESCYDEFQTSTAELHCLCFCQCAADKQAFWICDEREENLYLSTMWTVSYLLALVELLAVVIFTLLYFTGR